MGYIEKFYSDAFQDGFDYVSERLYAEKEEEKKRGKGAYVAAGLGVGYLGAHAGSHLGANAVDRNWRKKMNQTVEEYAPEMEKIMNDKNKSLKEKIKSSYRGLKEKYGKENFEKLMRGSKIGAGAGLGLGAGLGVGSVALYRHYKDKNKD